MLVDPHKRVFPAPHRSNISLTVGREGGDLRGEDQRAIQAAIEYVAGLGGGTVRLLPAVYECYNTIRLRSGVRLVGAAPGVVLRKSAGFETPLTLDADYGETTLCVSEPDHWSPGMGVTVGDNRTTGWQEVVATVTAVEDELVYLDRPLTGADVAVERGGVARHIFPVIAIEDCERVEVADLVVEGARLANGRLNGCIGAGVYAYRSRAVTLRRCTVRDFNGDGISFQTTDDLVAEGCEVRGCTGLGLHPGSGSQRPKVLGCRLRRNGEDGLFLCWRVQHGVFADNEIEGNSRHGLSLGHKDTHNLFEGNRILGNGGHGVLFREESEDLAAHECVFRRNTIEDNGRRVPDGCGIRVEGATTGLSFQYNRVLNNPGGRQRFGLWVGPRADGIAMTDNLVEGHELADVLLPMPGGSA